MCTFHEMVLLEKGFTFIVKYITNSRATTNKRKKGSIINRLRGKISNHKKWSINFGEGRKVMQVNKEQGQWIEKNLQICYKYGRYYSSSMLITLKLNGLANHLPPKKKTTFQTARLHFKKSRSNHIFSTRKPL